MNKNLHFKARGRNLVLFTLLALALPMALPSTLSASPAGEAMLRLQAEKRVTINVKDATLRNVLLAVQRQSGIGFAIDEAVYNDFPRRTLNVNNVTVADALRQLVTGTGYNYRFVNGMIVIEKAAPNTPPTGSARIAIRGRVLSAETRQPLVGATVTVPGTTIGTSTDSDGRFALSLMQGQKISVQYVGMEPYERVVEQSVDNMVVELKTDVKNIEEVVVTGIFTRKKEGFTGSATQITGEEVRRLTSGNILKALELIDPGFRMEASNMTGSNPNAVPDFQMRGQASIGTFDSDDKVMLRGDLETRPNQPLFVLDGIIGVNVTTIMDLDPEQIESITLLKDAAATVIYGSNAANGVVVVETKAPEPGRLRVSYNGNFGVQIPDLSVYDLMNAKQKVEIETKAGYYDNQDDIPLQNYWNSIQEEVLRGVDTYWLKEPVRTAFTHRHGLNLEGGDRTLRYKIYLGAGFSPGVMKGTNLNTKSGKADIIYRAKKILISNQIAVDYTDGTRISPYGEFQEYALMNPYLRKRDEFGNYQAVLNDFIYEDYRGYPAKIGYFREQEVNPLWNTQFKSKNENRNLELRENLKVEYLPMENLRLSLDFTLTQNNGTTEVFKSAQHTDFLGVADPARKGQMDWTKNERTTYYLSLSAAYNKTFGEDHLLSAFARYSINENSLKTTTISKLGFPNDRLNEVHMGTTDNGSRGQENKVRSLGFMFTLNYMFKQRYAIDYSMRIDASSEFGRNNRFAPFWSAGVRWNAEKEEFIKRMNVFDELVLRATYGVTGSQGFTPYQSLQMYSYTGLMKTYLSFPVVGTQISGMGNPDLKWQQTDSFNLSLDFTMLRNLISAKVEYYRKDTKNSLLDYSLAPSTGFNTVKENLGKIANEGYEITLRVMPYSNAAKQSYWQITATGGRNKSKIKELSNAMKVMNEIYMNQTADRPLPRYENGHSQTLIWAVPSFGIDPATGREVFIRRDGGLTYEYRTIDQVPVGDKEPTFAGALSTTFTYRGLTLSIAAKYFWGGQMFNSTLLDKVENAALLRNADRRALTDRWQSPGDKSFFKGIDGYVHDPDLSSKTKASSRFVMDNNELALSTINLSYRMDKTNTRFMGKSGISSATISIYMEELARMSTIKMERGIDYPFARQISMSLNIIF